MKVVNAFWSACPVEKPKTILLSQWKNAKENQRRLHRDFVATMMKKEMRNQNIASIVKLTESDWCPNYFTCSTSRLLDRCGLIYHCTLNSCSSRLDSWESLWQFDLLSSLFLHLSGVLWQIDSTKVNLCCY